MLVRYTLPSKKNLVLETNVLLHMHVLNIKMLNSVHILSLQNQLSCSGLFHLLASALLSATWGKHQGLIEVMRIGIQNCNKKLWCQTCILLTICTCVERM